MPIFKIEDSKLISIKEVQIDLEKDLQKITENNLEAVLGYKLVSSEFSLHNLRIDTLAFDEETNSFVVIEFKRDRSFSVIDQGYAYLSLLLNNKADFILEYNEKMSKNLKKDDIDWTQSKVIFFANSFTTYQQNAISFRDLPIELWEVRKYNNNTILYNQLKTPESNESIKTVSKNQNIENVSREVKKYSLEDHLKKDWGDTADLYEQLKERIMQIDPRIEEKFNKFYIGYKIKFHLVCALHLQKSKIRVDLVGLDKEDFKDPEDKIIKVKWQENNWNKQCSYNLVEEKDIDYALFLIKQVYDKLYK